MLNNQLMSDLDADEGLAEICVNEFIADTIKAVKDAGVKKITVEFLIKKRASLLKMAPSRGITPLKILWLIDALS